MSLPQVWPYRMLLLYTTLAVFVSAILMMTSESAHSDTAGEVSLYLSADRTGTRASGIAIEQGIRTALSENNNRLGPYRVSLKVLDHRGSTPRATRHLEQYLNDPTALVLFSGLHSPPLLANRTFINTQKILVLNPWAAAGPITRYPSEDNWIFRLSIDDSKAGYVITDHALGRAGVQRPALLLEQTGWGRSNQVTMSRALESQGKSPAAVTWFNWGLSEESARILLREINRSGADAIFLVANAPEGKVIARAMFSLPESERLPIFSHWGITGGDFANVVGHDIRQHLQLDFIQTSFSFMGTLNPFQQQVLAQARSLFPETIKQAADIQAPTGFIHAYDLTRILIAAVAQADLSGDIQADRMAVRHALESLETPVQGLIKTYKTPFSPYSDNHPDAHEALGRGDFRMARYGRDDEIILYELAHPEARTQ